MSPQAMGHADTHRPGTGRHLIGWGLAPREVT